MTASLRWSQAELLLERQDVRCGPGVGDRDAGVPRTRSTGRPWGMPMRFNCSRGHHDSSAAQAWRLSCLVQVELNCGVGVML